MSDRITGSAEPGAPPAEHAAWLPLLLIPPFAMAGLVDFPRQIRAGSITALGFIAAGQVGLAVIGLLAARAYPRLVLWRFAPYGLFVAWMIGRSPLSLDQAAVQNGLAYLLFGLQAVLAATLAARRPAATAFVLGRGVRMLDALALGLVAVSFVRFGLPCESCDTWLVGPRAVGLLAIVPIGWHVAGWCHGRRGHSIRALTWIVAVLASLSRTATAVAFIIAAIGFLMQMWIAPRRFARRLPAVAVAGAVLLLLVASDRATFYERFFEGYNNVDVAGVPISTSGRNSIWPTVVESGMRHPVIGGGLGSSQSALEDFDPNVVGGHPHNDYLRVWHDGGIFGIGFLMFAFSRWLVLLRRQSVHAWRTALPHAEIDLAGLLTLLGLLLAAITDNGFVYSYVMGPAGIVMGAALGVRVRAVWPAQAASSFPDARIRMMT
jgi:O-antigen ligase